MNELNVNGVSETVLLIYFLFHLNQRKRCFSFLIVYMLIGLSFNGYTWVCNNPRYSMWPKGLAVAATPVPGGGGGRGAS